MQEDPAGQEVQVYPSLCCPSFPILNAALCQKDMELCQGLLGCISGEGFLSRAWLSTGTSSQGSDHGTKPDRAQEAFGHGGIHEIVLGRAGAGLQRSWWVPSSSRHFMILIWPKLLARACEEQHCAERGKNSKALCSESWCVVTGAPCTSAHAQGSTGITHREKVPRAIPSPKPAIVLFWAIVNLPWVSSLLQRTLAWWEAKSGP